MGPRISVQYHLIVLGLKYEISLQICPEETGDAMRAPAVAYQIDVSPTQLEKEKEGKEGRLTLVSGDNDCLVCFCGSAWTFQGRRKCSH